MPRYSLGSEIDHLVRSYGIKRVLEELIAFVDQGADEHDYLTKLATDLEVALTNYEDRYKEVPL